MAILRLEDGRTYQELSDITQELASLNIQLKHLPIGENLDLPGLLAEDILSIAQKEQVLATVDSYFQEFKRTAGYQWCDLLVLHPSTPHLYALLL